MTSYTQPNFDQIWWKNISEPVESEMFHVLQYDSTKCAPQYERNSLVTMVTYWVPDLPNIKGISGNLWSSILICANNASYARFSKYIKMLAQYSILKSSEWGLVKSELPWEHNFYSPRCVSCRPISLPSFNGLRCKLTKIALFMYLI